MERHVTHMLKFFSALLYLSAAVYVGMSSHLMIASGRPPPMTLRIFSVFDPTPPSLYFILPPPPPPFTEHMPLHSKSLFKNMARAYWGTNNMRPLSLGGGTNGKDPFLQMNKI